MSAIAFPDFHAPALSHQQVARVLSRPRATIAGWISRYSWLGVDAVSPGETRRFSFHDLGLLVALRLALDAGNMAEALSFGIDLIEPEIEADFAEVSHTQVFEEGGRVKLAMPSLDNNALRVVSRGPTGLLDGGFYPNRSTSSSGAYIADLAGFQVPETVLHLGQGLQNAWGRALLVLHGITLPA